MQTVPVPFGVIYRKQVLFPLKNSDIRNVDLLFLGLSVLLIAYVFSLCCFWNLIIKAQPELLMKMVVRCRQIFKYYLIDTVCIFNLRRF